MGVVRLVMRGRGSRQKIPGGESGGGKKDQKGGLWHGAAESGRDVVSVGTMHEGGGKEF